MIRILQKKDSMSSNTTMSSSSPTNSTTKFSLSGSQSTADLSFDEGDDDFGFSDGRPTVVVLEDYESDSLGDLSLEPTVRKTSRGGLRRYRSSSSHYNNDGRRCARSVTFSEVKTRIYSQCVGDNPAVSLGVPISLSWQILSEETTTVDAYDPVHPQGRREPDLAIPATERDQMVRTAGCSTMDIRNAVKAVNCTKMEREKTLDTLKNASSEEFMEKLRKGVLNATMRRKSKKGERALLQQLRHLDSKRAFLVSPAC